MDLESPAASKAYKPMINSDNIDNTGKKKKRRNICIGTAVSILLLIILVIVLVTVVFKAKDPEVNINSISLEDLNSSLDILNLRVNLNVSLGVSVAIRNPNKVGVSFTNTSVIVNYRGRPVGDAPVPASRMSAGGTLRLNVTLTIMADRLMGDAQIYRDVIGGSIPLSTSTKVSGKVSILGIKIHVRSSSTCDITVFVSNRTIGDQHCKYNTKI